MELQYMRTTLNNLCINIMRFSVVRIVHVPFDQTVLKFQQFHHTLWLTSEDQFFQIEIRLQNRTEHNYYSYIYNVFNKLMYTMIYHTKEYNFTCFREVYFGICVCLFCIKRSLFYFTFNMTVCTRSCQLSTGYETLLGSC